MPSPLSAGLSSLGRDVPELAWGAELLRLVSGRASKHPATVELGNRPHQDNASQTCSAHPESTRPVYGPSGLCLVWYCQQCPRHSGTPPTSGEFLCCPWHGTLTLPSALDSCSDPVQGEAGDMPCSLLACNSLRSARHSCGRLDSFVSQQGQTLPSEQA